MQKLLTSIFLMFLMQSFCQVGLKLKSYEEIYQNCLDNSPNRIECSHTYYTNIHELLNETIKSLVQDVTSEQTKNFQIEQKKWLEQRKRFFTSVEEKVKHNTPELMGTDLQMACLDEKASFLKERLLALAKKYKL